MSEIICKCGHNIDNHWVSCNHENERYDYDCDCKLTPQQIADEYFKQLKQVEANYDALQSPMPCGHLARYAVNVDVGTQYCVMCVLDATNQTIANLVLNDVEDTDEKCPFCRTRAILKRVEQLLDFVPEINSDHYDSVIANLSNDVTSAHSYFMCYCEDNHAK